MLAGGEEKNVFVIYEHACTVRGIASLTGIALEWLANPEADEPLNATKSYLLSGDISGLWKALAPDLRDVPTNLVHFYSQWDDCWLLYILRNHYYTGLKGSSGKPPNRASTILQTQLEELLGNRTKYCSLFKRADGFAEIDRSFAQACFNTKFLERLKKKTVTFRNKQKLLADIQALASIIKSYILEHGVLSRSRTNRVEQYGLFCRQLFDIIRRMGYATEGVVYSAAKEFQIQAKFEHVIAIPKTLSPGLSNQELLWGGDAILTIGEISGVACELERASNLFPPFFIYICSHNGVPSRDAAKLQKRFGQILFKKLENLIT